MKKFTLLKGALAFAAASLIGVSLHAQQTIPTNDNGDLMLDFSASGGPGNTYQYEVDLGQFSQFLPGGADATGAPVSLGSYVSTTDLSGTYGANWDTDGDLQWGVVGTLTNNHTGTSLGTLPRYSLFGTVNDETPVGQASSVMGTYEGAITPMYGDLHSNYESTPNSDFAAFLPISSGSDSDSFSSLAGSSVPYFGYFDQSLYTTAQGTSTSELWYIPATNGAQGTELGVFSLSNSGLTFQSVPEPSTWATIVLGAATLIGLRRRRRA